MRVATGAHPVVPIGLFIRLLMWPDDFRCEASPRRTLREGSIRSIGTLRRPLNRFGLLDFAPRGHPSALPRR